MENQKEYKEKKIFNFKKHWLPWTIFMVVGIGIIIYAIHFGPSTNNMRSVQTTLTFGNTGGCYGTGICNCVIAGGGNPPPNSILTTFYYDPSVNGNTKIQAIFNINSLNTNEPEQATFFNGSTYNFPTVFVFPQDIVNRLNLPVGAMIMPTTAWSLTRNAAGDSFILSANFSMLQATTPSFINRMSLFGNPMVASAAPACDPTVGGICSLTVPGSATTPPTAIPVSIMTVPGNLDQLSITFSYAALDSAQAQQGNLFPHSATQPRGTYRFTAPFVFDQSIRDALSLTGDNPGIPAGDIMYAVTGDQVIMTFTYSHNIQP